MVGKTQIFLITGFLGAGKTSLFQRISAHTPFDTALIIVNEFGDTGVDDQLMRNKNGQAQALAGGCVCCSSRHELLTSIQIALAQIEPPSAIMIETTGLASPYPILKALSANAELSTRLQFRTITVIDATNALSLVETQHMVQEQLALADAIVLTKTDLMQDASALAALIPFLQNLNPVAGITHSAEQTDDALAHWFSQMSSVAENGKIDMPKPLGEAHIGTLQSILLTLDRPVHPYALEAFLFEAARIFGPELLRLKGFARVHGHNDALWLVQMVQGVVSPPDIMKFDTLPVAMQRQTHLVAIADAVILQALQTLFAGILGDGAIGVPDAQALNDNPLAISGL